MALAGRRREMAEVGRLLDGAADGRGSVLAITGPQGSGRTELAAAAAREGARRGFTVLSTAVIRGQPGRLAWAPSMPACMTAAGCITCAPCWPRRAATFRRSTW